MRTTLVAAVLAVLTAPGLAVAQAALPPGAASLLEQLRATGSPGAHVLVRDGRTRWLGGLAEPASALDPEEASRAFVLRHGALTGHDGGVELATHSVRDVGGTTFVRFEARREGRLVIGSQTVVSIRDGLVRHVAVGGRPFDRILEGRLVPAEAARRAVEAESGRAAAEPTELAWLGLSGTLVPVWLVPQREAAPARDWRYLVEATTGTVLWRHDQLLRAEGFVYDPNPVRARDVVDRVTLENLESDEVLEGAFAAAWQCVGSTGDCSGWGRDCVTCGQREHYAVAQPDGNFLYPPSEPDLRDPFAEVQAYFHVDRVNRFFAEQLGFARRCGGRQRIDVFVNYHVPGDAYSSANAFYGDVNGDGCGDITLGEGLGIDFSYDADVIYHEFAHGIVEAAGGLGCAPFGPCLDELGLDWTSIGLNEGYADYYSVTLTGDPELGEHAGRAMTGGEGMIRNADNDYLCPFDLIGESHYDGQIWAGAGWEIRAVLGAEIADQVLLRALMALPSDAGYAEAGEALLASTRAERDTGEITDEQLAEVEAILGPEGRRILGCERVIPLDRVPPGHAEQPLMLGTYMGMTFPTGIHWSLTAPRRATRLVFRVDDQLGMAERLVVHVRRGEPVGVAMTFNPSTGLRTVYDEDFTVTPTDGRLVLDESSDPALEAETTYYFVVEYACSRGCYLGVTGEVEGEPNTSPVAVAGEDVEVELGATVELDGAASHDPDGDELTYRWAVHLGGDLAIEDADNAQASLLASELGEHIVELVVTDSEGGTGRDTLTVTVVPGEDPGDSEGGCGCRAAGAPGSLRAALVRLLVL